MLDQRLRSWPQTASCYERWTGRKASSAAVAACLRHGDTVLPTARGLLANYLHSGLLTGVGKNCNPQAQLAAANEDAAAHRLKKRGDITAVFAATPQPVLMRKVFTLSAKQSLPILYILEGGTPPAEFCHGIPVIRVDASDTVAAYRVAYESTTRAREGGGPTIIECASWPGDPQASDPLLKLENYLAARKLFRPRWKRSLEMKFFDVLNQGVSSFTP